MLKSQRGQFLIETLIALTVAIVIVGAISSVVISALNNAQFSKNQNLATQYAQEGLELMRRDAKSNWTTFKAYDKSFCLRKDKTQVTATPSDFLECRSSANTVGIFTRVVDIARDSSDCSGVGGSKVKVIVSWSDGSCPGSNAYCHKVNLQSCFTNPDNTLSP